MMLIIGLSAKAGKTNGVLVEKKQTLTEHTQCLEDDAKELIWEKKEVGVCDLRSFVTYAGPLGENTRFCAPN